MPRSTLDFATLDRRAAYRLLTSVIAPRPVAWVSTLSADGRANLAPFSFFQMIAPHPPTVMICPQHNADGSLKDTARNIRDTGEFVVNLVSFAQVEQMNASSWAFGPEESEFELVGIAATASTRVAPPSVTDSPASLECTLASFTLYPDQQPTCAIVLGTVVAAHVDTDRVSLDGPVDPNALDLVSRMGADWYGRTRTAGNFSLPRPQRWVR
jgi:flavin reductase (DIM6/NTAB) family NADH-FMN oxidoreductase RutF